MFSLRRKHEVSDQELSALIDGQLAPAARERVERHAEACAACSEKLSDLRSMSLALGRLPRAAAPRSFAVRGADLQPTQASAERWGREQAVMGAATAAVFIAFGVLVGVDASSSSGSEDEGISGPLSSFTSTANAPAAEGEAAMDDVDNSGGVTPQSVGGESAEQPENGTAADGATENQGRFSPGASPPSQEGSLSYDQSDEPGEPDRGAASGALTPTAPGADLPETTGGDEAAAQAVDDENNRSGIRAAEAALAAAGVVGLGGLAFVWWRRRSVGG